MKHETALTDLTTIGKRLRYVRDQKLNISRPAMADLMGIPPTTLKNYELDYREFGTKEAMASLWAAPAIAPYAVWILSGAAVIPVQVNPVEGLKAAA